MGSEGRGSEVRGEDGGEGGEVDYEGVVGRAGLGREDGEDGWVEKGVGAQAVDRLCGERDEGAGGKSGSCGGKRGRGGGTVEDGFEGRLGRCGGARERHCRSTEGLVAESGWDGEGESGTH